MILGLTLGTSTIGWALLKTDANGASGTVAQGVRIFPTGTTGDVESGRDVSRNDRRQAARQHRVQLRRRAGRLKKLFGLLQGVGWLPPGEDRHTVLETLKRSPYELRARALDEPLEPFDLGRAIYHLAHRRGFKSNRRTDGGGSRDAKKEEELGIVKTAILDLENAIRDSGTRTLGEYLFKLDTVAAKRRRWTGRSMYVQELDAILTSQARFREIPVKLRQELTRVIFDQKPLKSQAGRIGRCSLETSRKRMLLAHPIAQEFRMLQKVNDLRAVDDMGVETVSITQGMREKLVEYLRANGDTSFAEVRKVLGLPKTVRFNFEREDEKKLLGDRTRQSITEALANTSSGSVGVLDTNLEDITLDILTIDEEKGVLKRLTERWGIGLETSQVLANAKLEAGHLMHSRKAVMKLLPLMRTGVSYATAVKELYGAVRITVQAREQLPLVRDAFPYLANPLVSRALGELRKLVNAVVKKYGKPERIRIELHRQLQMGPKARMAASIRMRAQQREKEKAAERLLQEVGISDPTHWQVERVLLANECGWICPFTGKTISIRALMRDEATFYVMHLVPFHMSLDDGWRNKTLAHISVHEMRKDALLSELWPNNTSNAKEVEARFGDFQGSFAKEKLRRFRLTREEAVLEYDEAYAERFLESSSYVARLAREYLSMLYGSTERESVSAKVEATRGKITSFVREAVGLSSLRREMISDYRHYVLDAVAVALTSSSTVRALCVAAKIGNRRRFGSFPEPWKDFVEGVTNIALETVPSFRVTKRVRGPLHEETNYSRPMQDAKGTYHLLRKSLSSLTKSDIELIAGKQIQSAVITALQAVPDANGDPRKAFADAANLPIFNGRPTRRVRIVRREGAFAVGDGASQRYVTTEQNHHALVRVNDKGGWVRQIVSLYEARRRMVTGERIYQKSDTTALSIAPGEILQLKWDDGIPKLVRVRSVSKDPRIAYVDIGDSRKLKNIIETQDLYRESVEQLRKRQTRKVFVNVLGEVRRDGT